MLGKRGLRMKKEVEEFLEDSENIEILKKLIGDYKREQDAKLNEAMIEIKTNNINPLKSLCGIKYGAGKLTVLRDVFCLTYTYSAVFNGYAFNNEQSKALFKLCESFYHAENKE